MTEARVKRFKTLGEFEDGNEEAMVRPCEDGWLIRYEDYQQLEKERDAQAAMGRELKEELERQSDHFANVLIDKDQEIGVLKNSVARVKEAAKTEDYNFTNPGRDYIAVPRAWFINLQSALAASPSAQGSGWQPIETAPKDGTRILIAGKLSEGFYIDTAYWDADSYHEGWANDEDDAGNQTFFGDPTHWMPLPAPPADLGKEKG